MSLINDDPRLPRAQAAMAEPMADEKMRAEEGSAGRTPPANGEVVLRTGVSVEYAGNGGFRSVLRDASLEVRAGEVVGLVGSSGCGKSTFALTLMRLLDERRARISGEVIFTARDGGPRDLLRLSERAMRSLRGREISLVLQSPLSSLNPVLRLGTQMREAWRAHSGQTSAGNDWKAAALEALRAVALPAEEEFLRRFPSQISIGQAQRVLIAMAILHRPRLLIADEPTSALDVITQAEVLKLFASLNQKLGMGLLFISHDLRSVAGLCHQICIMHEGQIVERGTPQQIFHAPQHEFTKALVRAMEVTKLD